MKSGIYEIVSPSGRRYIGSAVNINRRWTRHRTELKGGYHGNAPLQRAADKYGLSGLQFNLLLVCRPDDLLMYEQLTIDGLMPEYNLAPIAGSSLGIKRTEEFKRKVSDAGRRRIVSEETRAKIGAAHRGKKLPPHQIEMLKARNVGRKLTAEQVAILRNGCNSPEARAKRIKALTGHPVSEETREKIRKSVAASWARRKQEVQ